MKTRTLLTCIIGLLLFASNGFSYLYTHSIRFQESLDVGNKRFYFKASDYSLWSRNRKHNSTSTIYSYSFKDGSIKNHYKAEHPISQIRYLPENGLVSFVSLRSLYLVNDAGVKVGGFTDNSKEGFIPEYVWNHDRTKVAYLLAKVDLEEGKEGPPYAPLGVWIYDLETGGKAKIADWGMYLETDLDRKYLYFRTVDASYRYEFATGRLELFTEMKLKSLNFLECSNDRQYCAVTMHYLELDGPYESSMAFYDNKRGEMMTPEELDFFKGINATSVIWGNTSKYMAFKADRGKGSRSSSVYIFDFEEKKIVEKLDIRAKIVGTSPDRSTLCIYNKSEDSFFLKEFPKE